MKHILTCAALTLCALAPAAQNSQKFTATKASEFGLSYTLPTTVFSVTLEAERTDKKPGEFALYAKRLLGIDPILKPSTSWRLKAAEIIPVAIADPDQRYLAQFKNNTSPFIRLTPEGFPIALNDDSWEAPAPKSTVLKSVAAEPTILELPVATQAVTPDMLRATSTAKRAELAAQRIMEIRQNRADIIAGEADGMPADGQAMQLALSTLDEQEQALTAMFAGTTSVSTAVESYMVTPPAEFDPETGNAAPIIIARVSPLTGLVEPDDLSGSPVTIEFRNITTADLPVNDKGVQKTFPKGGVAYRIPGQADIVVADFEGNEVASAPQVDVAQYGLVFGLEPNLFTDKKNPSYLHFSPISGSVLELGTLTPQ